MRMGLKVLQERRGPETQDYTKCNVLGDSSAEAAGYHDVGRSEACVLIRAKVTSSSRVNLCDHKRNIRVRHNDGAKVQS